MSFLVNPYNAREIHPGYYVLTNNSKTRAFWNFTSLSGAEDTTLTSHPDLTGTWTLSDNGGLNTPKLGYVQDNTTLISCLKANTSSGVKNAFITPAPSTNLLIGSHDIFLKIALTDGQPSAGFYLLGSRDGGTRAHDLFITTTGALQIRYAAGATGMSTLATAAGAVPNNYTGILGIAVRMDFVNDVITGYVNGVPYGFTLSSGNALSTWNPASWISTRACGIGGSWDGAFAADTVSQYKQILKAAVCNTLSDDDFIEVLEYLAI